METTNNYPTSILEWLKLDDDQTSQIIEWVKTRPRHDLDTCVNSQCRWTFKLTDHGVWTDIEVVDNADGTIFTVEDDPDLW